MIDARKSWVAMSLALVAGMALVPDEALAGKKLLRLKFDGAILESPQPDASFMVLFGQEPPRTLRDWVTDIDKAAKDSTIAGAVMVIDNPSFNLAQVDELSRALRAFREKGKKVYCYTDTASNGTYALACAADHITLAENSSVDIVGLHAELDYYKGAMEKLGCEMEVLTCGAYKAALESFVRSEPSEEFLANMNWLLDGIYARWIQLMAEGRQQSVEQIQSSVDSAPLEAHEALQRKLVDAVGSWADFRQMLRKEYGSDVEILKTYGAKDKLDIDFENPFAIFSMFSDLMEKARTKSQKPGIALIYIEGPITTGKSQQDMLISGGSAGSTTIRAALDKAADDDTIKAVVVRVDSPGGSAVASDIIWKAASRLAKQKPLIVSMGAVAGSGGYYVSIPGDTIFAEEATITGSIGVVGGKLVWNGLWEGKLGVTTTELNRGKRAGLMSMNRKWSDDERSAMRKYMDNVYEQFKGRIQASRGDRLKGNLDDMAGGRVFTGRQALERGLVDQIGGLSDAIRHAASKAGLSDYEVYVLPKQKDLGDILASITGKTLEDEYEVSLALPSLDRLLGDALPTLRQFAPDRFRSLALAMQQLLVIERERVSCWMPVTPRIR